MTSSNFRPQPWQAPSVNPEPTPEPLRLTAERIEALEAEVRDEARAAGYAEGLAEGREAVQARLGTLDALLSFLADPLHCMDRTLEETLLTLTLSFAEGILRQAPPASRESLEAVLREALDALPDPQAEAVVRLAPADLATLEAAIEDAPRSRPWRLEADASLGPGDVWVVAGLSEVDATRRTRLRQLFDGLLPQQGEGDTAEEDGL
jgi:flagellar assembly protein FliH